jgi:hypothetical protein
MTAHDEWLEELLREQFAAPTPDWKGPVNGPTARAMQAQRRADLTGKPQDPDLLVHAEYQRTRRSHEPISAEVLAGETRYRRRASQRRKEEDAA